MFDKRQLVTKGLIICKNQRWLINTKNSKFLSVSKIIDYISICYWGVVG